MNQGVAYETRLELALEAIKSSQIKSIRAAATLYDIPQTTI